MVNQKFLANFNMHVNEEFRSLLAKQPVINTGGTQMDHYKGLLSGFATRVVPFLRETYESTEFIFGHIPLKSRLIPKLFFQSAVLDIKGKNIPGVVNLGAVLPFPIPETYVAPYADWKHRLLPLSAFTSKDVSASKVFKKKVNWTPLLEAVNSDKPTRKALGGPWNSSRVGDYKIKMDSMRIVGFYQLAPYKGFTFMTLESTPGIPADIDKPHYDLKKHYDNMMKIATHVSAHPKKGQDEGPLFLVESNAAMIDLMMKHVEVVTVLGKPMASRK